jgi:branched-chain amino acid transport system permease protein
MELIGSIAIDGVAYGMVLFMVAVGLAVTMGLTRVINLAQGAFAMFGGYACALLTQEAGVPFAIALPLTAVLLILLAWPIERFLIRRIYHRNELDQALVTIGFLFICVATANLAFGASLRNVVLPDYLSGSIDLGFRYLPKSRLLPILVGLFVYVSLWWSSQ